MKSVYVIATDGAGTKIGVSKSPPRRAVKLKDHKTAPTCTVYFQTEPRPDAHAIEAIAHATLATRRIAGEWFDVPPDEAQAAVINALGKIEADPAYTQPGSSRQRRYHARNRHKGMVRISVLVPVEDADLIRRLAQRRRDRAQLAAPYQPEPGPTA